MTRKQRRSLLIVLSMVVIGIAVTLVLTALEDSIVFFNSPTDVFEKQIPKNQRFRLGGLVEEGSILRGEDTKVTFNVTDTNKSITVHYVGILPDLFRAGQGVVTEGKLNGDGIFIADSVLAKHDENYMPPEVADALRKQGVWRGDKKKLSNQ